MTKEVSELREEIKQKVNELAVLIGKAREMNIDVFLNESLCPSLVFDEAMEAQCELFIMIGRENSSSEINGSPLNNLSETISRDKQ